MTELSEEAWAVASVLIAHHREVCRPVRIAADKISNDLVNECTLTYGTICDRAKMPALTHIVGRFMGEIAQWCADNGWPPLNSLAVNAESWIPGASYDGAGCICELFRWPQQVRECIKFRKYPRAVPRAARRRI
jgi:hypothetical protein